MFPKGPRAQERYHPNHALTPVAIMAKPISVTKMAISDGRAL